MSTTAALKRTALQAGSLEDQLDNKKRKIEGNAAPSQLSVAPAVRPELGHGESHADLAPSPSKSRPSPQPALTQVLTDDMRYVGGSGVPLPGGLGGQITFAYVGGSVRQLASSGGRRTYVVRPMSKSYVLPAGPRMPVVPIVLPPLDTATWHRILAFVDAKTKLGSVTRLSQAHKEYVASTDCWPVADLSVFKACLNLALVSRLSPLLSAATTLDISECYDIQDDAVAVLVTTMLGLRSANFTGCTQITDEGMATVAQHCRNLTSLNLCCCMKVTDQGLISLSRGLKKLRNLNLWGCSELTDPAISSLIFCNPNLRSVDLTWCGRVSEGTLTALAACNRLESVTFMWCELNDAALKRLHDMKNLTTVNLDGCGKISDTGIKALAASCPNLHNLSIRFLTKVTTPALRCITKLKNMASLDIRHCDLLTEAVEKHTGASSIDITGSYQRGTDIM